MSKLFDDFMQSVDVLKKKSAALQACISAARYWKKTGGLTGEEYGAIVAYAERIREY